MSSFRTIRRGLGFAESPRWHDGRLWYVDFFSRTVRRTTLEGVEEVVAQLDTMPGGLGFLPDGTPLVVSQNDFRLLRISDSGKLDEHADLSKLCRGAANDMLVDRHGRAWVGHHGFDFFGGAEPEPSSIVCVEADGRVREAAGDLVFPNGMALLPGEGRLVVAESFANRLTVFDCSEDGELSNRQTFAQFEDDTPDGICSDREGAIWAASPMTARFVRVKEGGSITDAVDTADGRWAVACVLGGQDRRTLCAVTAATTLEDMPHGKSEAFIELMQVDVPGGEQ